VCEKDRGRVHQRGDRFAEYDMLKSKEPDYLYEDLSDWKKLLRIHAWNDLKQRHTI
jgi:hypothetical protein